MTTYEGRGEVMKITRIDIIGQNGNDGEVYMMSNNKLVPMYPYSCWSEVPAPRTKDRVQYGGGSVGHSDLLEWDHIMSKKCRYDKKADDIRCNGCQTEYDNEYVEGLKNGHR